jgi:hypothetical protein
MAFALKDGSSELLHADWHDYRDGFFTFILPVGDFTGAEFTAPQLGVKVPIEAGQICAVQTRRVVHYSAPKLSGKRYVLTLFVDQFLLRHALADQDDL